MTVWCLGSINIDHVYSVPHIPEPGETLAASDVAHGLGGKGANQSVAAARAGAVTQHIGAIGQGTDWVIERLKGYGVGTDHIARLDVPTGHAIINVAAGGENAIVTLPGANRSQDLRRIRSALSGAVRGDVLLIQNETDLQVEAATLAQEIGLRVLYSAAPFDSAAARAILPFIDTLLLNEIEAEQLEADLGTALKDLAVPHIAQTLGARGARWIDTSSGEVIDAPGVKVDAVDTTGAGDTFAGYLGALLSKPLEPKEAVKLAVRAASLKVTRKGAADAVPSLTEVMAFRP